MWRPIGKVVLAAIVVAVLGLLGFMALVRRDHKVEIVVLYPNSPPSAVWRLLTDAALGVHPRTAGRRHAPHHRRVRLDRLVPPLLRHPVDQDMAQHDSAKRQQPGKQENVAPAGDNRRAGDVDGNKAGGASKSRGPAEAGPARRAPAKRG